MHVAYSFEILRKPKKRIDSRREIDFCEAWQILSANMGIADK